MEEFIKPILTEDGSITYYNSLVDEHYHSIHGALQESKHVFLENGLIDYLSKNNCSEISILEVGFGTGLNFLLSADFAISQNLKLNYTGIESNPLSKEQLLQTNYNQFLKSANLFESFLLNYSNTLNKNYFLFPSIKLNIEHLELLKFSSIQEYDIIYYDAFANTKQSSMWTEESITHACKFLKDKGIFVTYSVTGQLKRILKGLGFQIERPKGAAGKREMMRATLFK